MEAGGRKNDEADEDASRDALAAPADRRPDAKRAGLRMGAVPHRHVLWDRRLQKGQDSRVSTDSASRAGLVAKRKRHVLHQVP